MMLIWSCHARRGFALGLPMPFAERAAEEGGRNRCTAIVHVFTKLIFPGARPWGSIHID